MRIYTDESEKILAVWLSADEHKDTQLMASLSPVISQFKSMKYQPVIYCSGTGNLQENTAALLRANRRAMAKQSTQ